MRHISTTTAGLIAAALMISTSARAADDAADAEAAEPIEETAATQEASAADEGPQDPWVEGEVRDLEELKAQFESISKVDLRDDEPALAADGASFESDLISATFDSGYFFPIFSGRSEAEWKELDEEASEKPEGEELAARLSRKVVGYVFVGEGTLEMRFPKKQYAMDYANHMVFNRDVPKAEMAPIAHDQAPVKTQITQAMVLTADPAVQEMLAGLPQVSLDGMTKSDLGLTDPVVVPEQDYFEKAQKSARKMFDDRLGGLKRFGVQATGWAASDRLSMEIRGADPANSRVFADFMTTTRYGFVVDKKGGDPAEDRHLVLVRDPTGVWDAKLVEEVFAAGKASGDSWGGKTVSVTDQPPHDPTDPLSAPLPPVRPEPVSADVTMTADLTRDGFYLDAKVTNLMTVRAVGGDLDTIRLRLGKFEAVDKTWKVKTFELEDGTPCTWLEPDSDDFKDMAGPITCILPKALREGGEVTIKIETEGTFPYANVMQGESSAMQGSLGLSTGLQMILPDVEPGFGGGWYVTQRVGLPVDSKLKAALSGATTDEWEADGKLWVEAKTEYTAMYPGFAVGNWSTVQTPAIESGDPNVRIPAVKVHLFDKDLKVVAQFPPEMRKILSFYQQYMPPFPWDEMELFQAPDMFYGYVWIAPHGMVNLQQTRVFSDVSSESAFRDGTPFMEQGVLAHELAHQYWGHTMRASHISEGWVNETMSETFSCLFVGAAYGADAFTSRMAKYREVWEERLPAGTWASETRAYESGYQPLIVYNYGPYMISAMLRPRIGDEAFFKALDSFARAHYREPISSEQFMAAIQAETDLDLTDFFEFWIYGGYVPDEVNLEWSVDGKKIVGDLTANIPFGTFDVPIRLTDKNGDEEVLWVDVVDGVGHFETENLPGVSKVTVELDPDGQILTRKRKVKKV